MSFFKKLREGLTSPKARVSLQFNKNSFVLGESVEGSLTVASDEEFDAKEIRCEFQCVEEARKMKQVYDPAVKHEVTREVQESATLYSAKPAVCGPMHMSRGFSQTFPFSVNIPVGCKPTFKSIDSKVSWFMKGVIAVDGRPDVTGQTMEVQVSAPSAAPVIKEKEVIREVVMIPCKYCGSLMPQTDTVCPHCGARRTV